MAARRPKDVSAWLGGNRGTVQSGSSNETQIDTGGGEKDAVNSTLALGLAGAAGLTAAGVALRKTGVGAQALNVVKNREVWVHASPVANLSQINPVVSPGGRPRFQKNTPLTFGTRASQKGTKEYLPEYVREVTTKYNPLGNVGTAGKPQSIYVTSVRKSDIVGTEAAGKWGISSGPQQVVSEIKIGSKTPDQLTREIVFATRRAGQSFMPQYTKMEKTKMLVRQKLMKIKNPPPKNRKMID